MSRSKITSLINRHQKLRNESINLIASENYLSPKVRQVLATDLAGRYHSNYYGGSKFAREIVAVTESLARRLFKAKYAIVTALSGNICDLAVLFALTEPNDKVSMLPFSVGGYPLGIEKFHRKRVDLPVNEKTLDIDVETFRRLCKKQVIKLTILGSSFILFPQPVRRIFETIKDTYKNNESHCVYDGSHILGLIACGEFQDPLREGAEVLFGSTHKTFYGPQGGLVLTNSAKQYETIRSYLELDLKNGIGLVDNAHLNRIAALGLALEEMINDTSYGKRTVKNAQTLARALDELGVPVKFRERGYTRSHQILLDLPPERAQEFSRELETIGIFIDIGGRLGVAEVTHRGYTTSGIRLIAELIAEVFKKGARPKMKTAVRDLAKRQQTD